MNEITTESWYSALKEELDAALTEMRHNARWLLIEWNHRIGEAVRTQMPPEAGFDNTLQRLAHDLGCSKRTLYNAVAIFDHFPTLDAIPDGKNASMNKLLKAIGRGTKEECAHLEVETIKICKGCGRRV